MENPTRLNFWKTDLKESETQLRSDFLKEINSVSYRYTQEICQTVLILDRTIQKNNLP